VECDEEQWNDEQIKQMTPTRQGKILAGKMFDGDNMVTIG
jgi:hypothetical protein